MNVAFREFYLKSDKDLEDARYLRIFFEDLINEEEINKIINRIKEFKL